LEGLEGPTGENPGASFKRTGRITHHAMENAIDKQIVLTFESSTKSGQPSAKKVR